MRRIGKLSRFKFSKIIFCLMDVIIVLLIAGFVFKLSQTNSQIEQLSNLASNQLFCFICKGAQIEYGNDSCCESITNGQCINMKTKKNCKEGLLEAKNKLVDFYTLNMTILIILGCIFFILECCCGPCLALIVKKLRNNNWEKEDSRLIKSGALSTLELQESSSSITSFSSLGQLEAHNMESSFYYKLEELACPVCLQTMEHQKVLYLNCKHIVHSKCGRKKKICCPICK